jgi:hypothetical protein
MGSPALWEHHNRNYNKDHDTPPEPIEPKRKTTAVKVVKTDTTGKLKKKELS